MRIVRHDLRRRALRLHVLGKRARRRFIRAVVALDLLEVLWRAGVREGAPQHTDARREVARARHELAVPEGHTRGRAGRRYDDHAVVLDAPNAPRGAAELERVADTRLVHELLVELTEPRLVPEVHGVQAAVGDGAARDGGDHARGAGRREQVGDAIPRDARFKLGGDVARILAGEHGEGFVERRARERMVRVRATHEVEERRAGPIGLGGNDGDDDLREHIERILHHACWLHVAGAHGVEYRELLQRIVTKRWNEDPSARCIQRVARSAHALQRGRDALGALDQEHEVHRADVDAELQRARGDERAQLAGLEPFFQQEPSFAREGAVIRQRDFLLRQRVHPGGDAFRLAAVVHEHECRARAANLVEHQWCDGRPDGAVHLAEIIHGRGDARLHALHEAAIDDLNRSKLAWYCLSS